MHYCPRCKEKVTIHYRVNHYTSHTPICSKCLQELDVPYASGILNTVLRFFGFVRYDETR